MTRLQDKAQAFTKQTVGQMLGDDRLVEEANEQAWRADHPGAGDAATVIHATERSKAIKTGETRTFILVLDQGEEAFKAITDFAEQEQILGASVTAIGAFSKAKLGWFDFKEKTYKPIEVKDQCEVLSLIGDLAEGDDGKASLHLHAVVGLQDGACRGGHFLSGEVQPTLEVTIIETAVHLRRKKRKDRGIALITL